MLRNYLEAILDTNKHNLSCTDPIVSKVISKLAPFLILLIKCLVLGLYATNDLNRGFPSYYSLRVGSDLQNIFIQTLS